MPRRVCVRSSINVDEFFQVQDIVKSGETISSTSYYRRPGGKGANVATAIAKASSRPDTVHFCGTINKQDEWLRDTLVSYGVGASKETLSVSEEPTGRAIIQISKATADNSIILLPGSNYAPSPLPLRLGSTYSHMLVQNEIPIVQTSEALTVAKVHKLVTIFNPSPVPTNAAFYVIPWQKVDWLIVNHDEANSLAKAFGKSASKDILENLAEALPTATGIVMTKGAEGVEMLLRDEDNDKWDRLSSQAGKPINKIINTTGAGDTFAGYLTASLLKLDDLVPSKEEMQLILQVAAEAATACCEKDGAMDAMPTLDEVKKRVEARGLQWPDI